MTELALRGLRLNHDGASFDGLDCEAMGKRIALVGDFRPLFALASGRARAEAGEARIDDVDLREAVLRGRLGVADPSLKPLVGRNVLGWLTAYARLRGEPKDVAQDMAQSALERLGLAYLGRYECEGLPAQSLYAARIAMASLTHPQALLVEAPSWTLEAAAVENALLTTVSDQAELLLCCDATRQPDLFLQCDSAILLSGGEAASVVPRSHWRGHQRHFAVTAIANHDALVERLRDAGAHVIRPTEHGQMWVTLPETVGSELLVEAALASAAGLRQMSPLFERLPEE